MNNEDYPEYFMEVFTKDKAILFRKNGEYHPFNLCTISDFDRYGQVTRELIVDALNEKFRRTNKMKEIKVEGITGMKTADVYMGWMIIDRKILPSDIVTGNYLYGYRYPSFDIVKEIDLESFLTNIQDMRNGKTLYIQEKPTEMTTEEAISFLEKFTPCPHYSYDESLGDGTTWLKCEECGETVKMEGLESARKEVDEFNKAIEALRKEK